MISICDSERGFLNWFEQSVQLDFDSWDSFYFSFKHCVQSLIFFLMISILLKTINGTVRRLKANAVTVNQALLLVRRISDN